MITATDLGHVRRCVELAREALDDGDEPFGSLLVSAAGEVLLEDRNRVRSADATRHPEIAIARWAAANLTAGARAESTVYTSGEHCPMCAAAHGWAGLGRIVYAASNEQLTGWLAEWSAPPPPVAPLPITRVVPGADVHGPVLEWAEELRSLHRARFDRDS
ncbi:nucleoside deaminase [Saccharopolyspora montiporae]|uniref:nucleoside deaminase n=1 Tax=Saccharopolyspora montiporae TaxID=2781240 RepID=UPI001D15B71E|nr:nucleoside deaminase [Saccharopolyspora sp. HNM0983]